VIRSTNNFGALRLAFAVLVILSHCPEGVDGNRSRELATQIFSTMSFGEIGVDGFFLISGYLITKSYLSSRSVQEYFLKRVLRIYPGYAVAFLLCVMLLGPYVGGRLTVSSITILLKNLAFMEAPEMPGVFQSAPYQSLNGAMWTIAYEFRCYVIVLLLGAAGVLSSRALVAMLAAICLAINAAHPDISGIVAPKLQIVLGDPKNMVRFLGVFECGAVFFLYRDSVIYKAKLASLAGVLLIACMFYSRGAEAALAVFGGYILFWFAFNVRSPVLAAVGRDTDLSYGVYLYAWPVENTLVWCFPLISPWLLFLETTAITALFAFGSWSLVEKPFLNLKENFVRALTTSA
jgi:peptidoglycan/LPS O-acetylase OafA/YrhL